MEEELESRWHGAASNKRIQSWRVSDIKKGTSQALQHYVLHKAAQNYVHEKNMRALLQTLEYQSLHQNNLDHLEYFCKLLLSLKQMCWKINSISGKHKMQTYIFVDQHSSKVKQK